MTEVAINNIEDSNSSMHGDPMKLLNKAVKKINSKNEKSRNLRKHYVNTINFVKKMKNNNILKSNEGLQPLISLEEGTEDQNDQTNANHSEMNHEEIYRIRYKRSLIATWITLIANITLFVSKIAASIPSNSISIISSTLESLVDLFASGTCWYMNHSIKKIDIYTHPQGKTRLEPLGIILISSIMSITSFQVIVESMKRIITKENLIPEFSYSSLGIIIGNIVLKLILFIGCYQIKTPTCQTLAKDHKNDVFSNIVVILGFTMSKYLWKYADPVGAICISIYLFIDWFITGKKTIGNLIGRAAPPETLQMITWATYYHDPRIIFIDTVRAFLFGSKYLAEVDIVLPSDMPLKEAHDIGESLQAKLEKLDFIERAYVHLDFEYTHDQYKEHKIGSLI